MRKSFVLFTEYKETFNTLSDEDAGKLIKTIFAYVNNESVEFTDIIKIAFIPIKQQLDRNNEKWEETREKRKIAGALGGQAKASKSKQELANASKSKQSLANVAVNENVNVNVKEKEKTHDDLFESYWTRYPKKSGKEKARAKHKLIKSVELPKFEKAFSYYLEQVKERDLQYIKQGSTFWANWADVYQESIDNEAEKYLSPVQKAKDGIIIF